ncbi:MAG: RagB/SusD family nutrient uptake outer membrane protein [bacterium]
MKNHKLHFLLPLLLLSLMLVTCTNLDENPLSSITPDNFFQTEEELTAALYPVYASLRDYTFGAPSQLEEVSSDEIFVPTRGGDWDDAGRWRALHQHQWTPTQSDINDGWVSAYRGIARANFTLENMERSPVQSPLKTTYIAELRVLRAFYYWWLCDLYGGVPIATAPVDPD